MLAAAQGDVHNYFVAHVFGPSAFAIYSVGCMQVPLIFMLRDSLATVLISKTSELQHQGRKREVVLLTARAMRKAALLFLPVYALLMVTGRDFLVFLYTRAYAASWPIFAINLSTLLLLVVITDPIVRAYAEQRYFVVRVRIAILVLQVAALWFATRAIGMKGAIRGGSAVRRAGACDRGAAAGGRPRDAPQGCQAVCGDRQDRFGLGGMRDGDMGGAGGSA